MYIDTYEIDKESVIIGNGGSANVHYDILFTPSKHVTVCNIIDKYEHTISHKYLYQYLNTNIYLLRSKFFGGGIKWLNRENIKTIPIIVPSIQDQ